MSILANKTAIVTGASSGIGFEAAKLFAKEGAKVVAVARRGEALERLVEEITAAGGVAVALAGDIKDEQCVRESVALAVSRFGGLDIAFNNAGSMGALGAVTDISLEGWHDTIDTNLTSAFLCSHAAYPEMMKTGGGKMINIGSMMSIFGASFTTAYAASKGGI
eukprot:gene11938-14598_t